MLSATVGADTNYRCKGILVKDAPFGEAMLAFEEGEKFHLPFRCKEDVDDGEALCEGCKVRQAKTEAAPKTRSSIKGCRPQYLNGVVGESIPFWSRMVGSAWYLSKLKAGYKLSEENMGKVKKAVEKAYRGEAEPKAEPIPGKDEGAEVVASTTKPSKGRKKPITAAPTPAPTKTQPSKPNTPTPVSKSPKDAVVTVTSTVATEPPEPIAIYEPLRLPKEIDTVVRIRVRKQEMDGRIVYFSPESGNCYDMKCNLLGRWCSEKEKIVPAP